MKLHIQHQVEYLYSRPIFCEPLTLRFRPRDDPRQRLLDHRLQVAPQPTGHSEYLDLEGNCGATIWFNEPVNAILLSANSTVETSEANQFEFLLRPEVLKLPMEYLPEVEPVLRAYRSRASAGPGVSRLANEALAGAGGDTVSFLVELNRRIWNGFRQIYRETGEPWPPEETFTRGEGACRDLATLFIAACQTVGIAARLVSGYQAQSSPDQQHHLHAWAEVYLPGGGWRGFDPTCGLAVTNRYVAVAAGRAPSLVSPTFGTYLGFGVDCQFRAQVTVATLDA